MTAEPVDQVLIGRHHDHLLTGNPCHPTGEAGDVRFRGKLPPTLSNICSSVNPKTQKICGRDAVRDRLTGCRRRSGAGARRLSHPRVMRAPHGHRL